MKKTCVSIALILCIGCSEGKEEQAPPEISIDVSPVWVGVRSIAEDAPAKQFDLQIRNVGEQTLELGKVSIEGDQHCAFHWKGPDERSLGANGSAFIRMWYKPLVNGNDSISLVVRSNSHIYDPFIVPICGRGTTQEEIDLMNDPDAGAGDQAAQECNAPPKDQPDCAETDTDTGA
jgi:hypothetical protein